VSAQFSENGHSSNGHSDWHPSDEAPSAARPPRAALENAFIHESQPSRQIVHVFGEVDLACVDQLQAAVEEAAQGPGTVVVDLAPCRYIDSSTLTLLVRLSHTYAGRFLIVVPPEGMVRRVFAITSLVDKLPIVDSLEEHTV
jgi:anti-anti-sigma factor